ncbi:MAG TPA: hypothetical protein VN818_03360 [Gammaproteobacteria bacterium]|nr:hypothetical protein [Gammaproteobacteria bacterium]
MERRIDRCLELCRHWAEGRVATGNEPPWAWYQYMKLIETVSAIQTSRAAASPAGGGTLAVRERAAPSRPKADPVSDIGAQRRRRARDDDDDDGGDPPLPM